MAACGSSGEWDAEVLLPLAEFRASQVEGGLAERSGVRFRGWKAMRATFGQRAVNAGVPIEKVSRAMRHKYNPNDGAVLCPRLRRGGHWTRSTGHSTSPLFVSAPAEGGASPVDESPPERCPGDREA